MASQNRTELASILNESAFRWSFGSPAEYVILLESFLKENNLPVPKFPDNFIKGVSNSSLMRPTMNTNQISLQENTFPEFPSYNNTSFSSSISPRETSGYSSAPTSAKQEQSPPREMTLKELVFLLLWDLIKQYKASCGGSIPDEVQRFLGVQVMAPPVGDAEVSVWYTWVSRRINVLIKLLGLSRLHTVNDFVTREASDSNEEDMIVDTIVDMLKANKI